MELNSWNNNDKGNTYEKMSWTIENDTIKKYKGYLSNQFGNKLNTKMVALPVVCQILKMHTNRVGLEFIIPWPKHELKSISTGIPVIFIKKKLNWKLNWELNFKNELKIFIQQLENG